MSNVADSDNPRSAAKFCPECGNTIPRLTAKFCPECGVGLVQSQENLTVSHSNSAKVKTNSGLVIALAIAIPVTAIGVFFLATSGFSFQPGGNSSNTNVIVPQPAADSYNIGFNAGKGLAAQNTKLYPNRTAMCGEAFQDYAGQSLDFDKFMSGCQSGFR
jgi:ribosomal protein S27AE